MKTPLIITLAVILTALGIGCASVSQLVTPAVIDTAAIDYVEKSSIADSNDFSGYPNLDKAIRLERSLQGAHQVNQLAYEQLAEKDRLDYAVINGTVKANRQYAQQREELLFGEQGLLSFGLSMAGFGTLTGFIGLMRKRPQDWTREEVEASMSAAEIELDDKTRHVVEIVRGVQTFIDSKKNSDTSTPVDIAVLEELKRYLAGSQSADTKEVVARVKSGL